MVGRSDGGRNTGRDVGGSSAHANFCSDATEEHDSETRLGWSDDRKFSGDRAWRPKLDSTVKNRPLRGAGFLHTYVIPICHHQTEPLFRSPRANPFAAHRVVPSRKAYPSVKAPAILKKSRIRYGPHHIIAWYQTEEESDTRIQTIKPLFRGSTQRRITLKVSEECPITKYHRSQIEKHQKDDPYTTHHLSYVIKLLHVAWQDVPPPGE
jgi:hypothetical protein